MGRKGRYETHVKPNLENIKEWIQVEDEVQIIKRLGIATSTFEKYKNEHEELRNALQEGREELEVKLKMTLKQKALGFKYKERKTTLREIDGKKTKVIEEFERYAVPDLGSIHLLLKNIDPDWHNDDKATLDLKKEQLELAKKKQEADEW